LLFSKKQKLLASKNALPAGTQKNLSPALARFALANVRLPNDADGL